LYIFQLFNRLDNNNEKQIEIKFEPKPGNPELLYQGTILIDETTNYILSSCITLEQDSSKSGKEVNLLVLKAQLKQYNSTALFSFTGTNYRTFYARTQVEMRMWNNKKLDQTFSFLSDLLANKVVEAAFEPISSKEEFNKKALYSLGNNYQTSYWKNQNAVHLTPAEERIIEQLR